jgi:hypothetical protein
MPVANPTPTTTTKKPVAKAKAKVNNTTPKPVVLTQEQLIQQYQEMVRKREEVDQQINMILNKDSPGNVQPELFRQTNRNISVNIMFVVLAVSTFFYVVRHLGD